MGLPPANDANGREAKGLTRAISFQRSADVTVSALAREVGFFAFNVFSFFESLVGGECGWVARELRGWARIGR